jgi:predicted aspartyl protease
MIASRIKEKGIEIQVTLKGDFGEQSHWAIVDTGFSLGIALSLKDAVRLGLSPISLGRVVTADGAVHNVDIFIGKVRLGNGDFKETTFIVIGDEILLGMAVLSSYLVCFHAEKKEVSIEQSFIKNKHISDLQQSLRKIIPR